MTDKPVCETCTHCRDGYFGDQRFGQDVQCVNGVLIDIDVAYEGWQPDLEYPVAPCHPHWLDQYEDIDFANDSQERLNAWADCGERQPKDTPS